MAKKRAKEQTVRTTVTIPAQDYAGLESIAKRNKVSVAWVVREAVEQYITSESPLFPRTR